MVVREFLEKNPNVKIWLCPNEHSSTSIAPLKYECALTYEKAKNVPNEILEAEVVRTWTEKDGEFADYKCIIWKNFKKVVDK